MAEILAYCLKTRCALSYKLTMVLTHNSLKLLVLFYKKQIFKNPWIWKIPVCRPIFQHITGVVDEIGDRLSKSNFLLLRNSWRVRFGHHELQELWKNANLAADHKKQKFLKAGVNQGAKMRKSAHPIRITRVTVIV
jgi:hypothetical protein